ncbi:MAG: hypothetical protein C4548_10540 [Desulfobacteraceae bacterium]|jgi:hypothetical protein|nr:MAG: hypothetical protein C4548_10540 [Desulfobacteraceae bacterium]
MKDIFKDVLGIDGVHGVIVLSGEGGILMSRFSAAYSHEEERAGRIDWASFVVELGDIMDAEFIFDAARFYVKKVEQGFLLVVMGEYAPISMVRLNCQVLSLDRLKSTSKRIGEILRKKIF